jgi:hypothetical protein
VISGNSFRRFILRLSLLTLLLLVAGFVVFRFFLHEWFSPWLIVIPAAAFLFSVITFAIQLGSSDKKLGTFTRTSLIITMARLLFYLSQAVIFLLIFRENGVSFVIALALFYLLFTSLEVAELSRDLRNKRQSRLE